MSASPYQFGFIGAGKLAGSVIRGLLLKNFCAPSAILASEPNAETRTQLQNELGISLTTENGEIAAKTEIVFLGVKPQMVLQFCADSALHLRTSWWCHSRRA